MEKNLGKIDSVIRIIIGIMLGYAFFNHYMITDLGIALISFSGTLITTGLLDWCPIYKVLGIRTCKKKSKRTKKQ